MKIISAVLVALAIPIALAAQAPQPAEPAFKLPTQIAAPGGNYRLVLPSEKGLLTWHIDSALIVQSSAKPEGAEIGVRARDTSGRYTFFAFLFSVPELAPMTGAICRDNMMESASKSNKTLKVLATATIARPAGLPVELVSYTAQTRDGMSHFSVRGFVASGAVCGDLEAYSEMPYKIDDPGLRKVFSTLRLDPTYTPQFGDIYLYAQILNEHGLFEDSAPIWDQAVSKLDAARLPDKNAQAERRAAVTQQGLAWGQAGDVAKARSIFEAAIAKDPAYPMYDYDLAQIDAAENKLADARNHLQQAFAHKSGLGPGEKLPDPAQDDAFARYHDNKQFFAFLQTLH